MIQQCENCRWSRSIERKPKGTQIWDMFCHRFPPETEKDWPNVKADDFCGEWQSQEANTAKEILNKIWKIKC